MTLHNAFYEMAAKEGISVFEMEMEAGLPSHHCIRLAGDHGIYEGHALFLEDERLFVFYVLGGLIVPEEQCRELAWDLMKENYGLKLGQWFIDPDSRVITLRTSQYLLSDEGLSERMRFIVESCGKLMDESYLQLSVRLSESRTK